MITELELTKLLSSAADACKKAEDGTDAAEEGRAVDALRVLAQQTVTADLLAKTEGGKRLKKLSKHPSSKISEAAAAAVQAWKECIMKEQTAGGSKAKSGASNGDGDAEKAGANSGSNRASQEPGGPSSQTDTGGMERASSNKLILEPPRTGDDTRDKIRKLLAEALAVAMQEGAFGDPCAAAVSVENAMHRQNGGVNQKYKAKYRTLSFNLKDPKNPDLRARVG